MNRYNLWQAYILEPARSLEQLQTHLRSATNHCNAGHEFICSADFDQMKSSIGFKFSASSAASWVSPYEYIMRYGSEVASTLGCRPVGHRLDFWSMCNWKIRLGY